MQNTGESTTSPNKANFWVIFENNQKSKNLSSEFGENWYIQLQKIPHDLIFKLENF
jgi:hypothetical protein